MEDRFETIDDTLMLVLTGPFLERSLAMQLISHVEVYVLGNDTLLIQGFELVQLPSRSEQLGHVSVLHAV